MPRTANTYRDVSNSVGAGSAANSLYLHGEGVTTPALSTAYTAVIGNVFTFMAWVRMLKPFGTNGSLYARQTLMSINGTAAGLQIEFGNGSNADGCFSVFMNGSWPATINNSPTPGVGLGVWTHIALTKSGSTTSTGVYGAYINGVAVTINKINDNDFADSSSGIILGGRGAIQPFMGNVKDLTLYNRVLSSAEINAVKDQHIFPASGRVFCYPCSEGSGTTTADAFGNAPVLTISSSVCGWSTDSPYIDRSVIAVSPALTLSGNEITDATRTTNTQGDGRATPDSSFGIWESTTNLVPNGGAETNTTNASNNGTTLTLSRDNTHVKFGSWAFKCVPAAQYDAAVFANITAAASTTYTASVWVYRTEVIDTLCLNVRRQDDAVNFTGFTTNIPATLGWTRTSVTFATDGSTTGLHVFVEDMTTSPQSSGFWVDGVQVEQKLYATPYVETNGSTASRSNATPQAPSGVLNAEQGWVIARVRPEWAATAAPVAFAGLFYWTASGAGGGKITLQYEQSSNTFFIEKELTGNSYQSRHSVAQSFLAGTSHTVIGAWTLANMSLSVDGVNFLTTAQQGKPMGLDNTFRIGTGGGGAAVFDAEIFWFAAGVGSLTNADATTINGWGDTDPTFATLNTLNGGAAQPTFLWTADTGTYQTQRTSFAPTITATASGNEITDAVRTTATSGDGRATPDSSYGIYSGTTNLWPNGGFESNTTGGTGFNSATLSRDSAHALFGTWALKIVTPGTVNNEGTQPSGGTYAAASVSTQYTVSCYVYSAAGGESVILQVGEYNAGSFVRTNATSTNATLVAGWQRMVTTVTTGTGITQVAPFFRTRPSNPAQAITVWLDGVQVEQKPFASPYVETNGSTASRSNARVQIPVLGALTPAQGWVLMRIRPPWDAGTVVNAAPRVFVWGSGTDFVAMYMTAGNSFYQQKQAGSTTLLNTAGGSAATFTAGQSWTVGMYWTPSQIGSVSGTDLTWQTGAYTQIPNIVTPYADIGSNLGVSLWGEMDYLWIAMGTGTLVNGDLSTIYAYGDTDPTFAKLALLSSGAANPTLIWTADTTSVQVARIGVN